MTVKQIINELKKYDENLPVTIDSDCVDLFSFEIESVGLANIYKDKDYVSLYGNMTE